MPEDVAASALLDALDGKKPLIKLSYRPPNYETPHYETPLSYFNDVITPNDAFFVRYHLSNIPEVRAEALRIDCGPPFAAALALCESIIAVVGLASRPARSRTCT